MPLIFYPKLSRYDLHLCRTPGPGLGNLLFAWARAEAYAAAAGGVVVAPTWRNLKLGTYLRGERDKRTYGDLFHHRSPRRFLGDLAVKLRGYPRITEQDYLSAKYDPRETYIVVVEGMDPGFSPVVAHRELIARRLREIAKHPVPARPPFIGVHIRAGDFFVADDGRDRANTRVPPSWFKTELQRVRAIVGDLPAVIFTDDLDGEVARQFAGTEIQWARNGGAIVDMLSLSMARHVICSRSSYSVWCAFLSEGTVSTRFHEVFAAFSLTDPAFLSRVI